jgi:flavorubredoxin
MHDKPDMIMGSYAKWIADDVENTVVIPYVSMHGSTQVMVDRLISALMARGIKAEPFFLSRADIGELAASLVQAATIVIGTPTVLQGPHPLAIYAATLAAALKPKTRFVSIVGSYGWGGKTVDTLAGIVGGLSVEVIEPVLVKGFPKDEDLANIDALADAIAAKHAVL